LTPQGKKFNQIKAKELSKLENLVLICGHYEGFDERIREHLVDEEISIGDYVLTGGELPAMVVTDAIVRLIPGVLEKDDATINESFNENLLEYPQYTRPEEYRGWKVPDILLSGDHTKIAKWRKDKSVEITKKKRSDLTSG
ncbi:MAG: tRNA (guanosine(37)-N1)-methyltransferase TrmD, partial [Candidatus Microgenomates bacterium]